MEYAQTKTCISNINPTQLILQDIWFNKRKLELAEASYHKATLNHDYHELNKSNEERIYRKALIMSAVQCLKYILAQESETNGRRVSADMREFNEVIEEMINGKQ